MKKVAFTLGLAFFAIGLFAQTTATTGNTAKPLTSAAVKKEPLKGNSMQQAQAKNQSAVSNTTHGAATTKTAPASTAKSGATSATAKPLAGNTSGNAPKKKHHAGNHKAATTTATGTGKNAPGPKNN